MPRVGDTYQLPAGTTVVSGTTIESAVHNTFVADVETTLNGVQPVALGGTGVSTIADLKTALGLDTLAKLHVVDSIAALRLLTATDETGSYVMTLGYYAKADYADERQKGSSVYVYDDADTTTADDDILTIVDASSRRWKLQHNGAVHLSQCGGYIDGETDDLAALNAIIAIMNVNSSVINRLQLDAGTFYTSDTPSAVYRVGAAIVGYGAGATEWKMASTAGTFLTVGYNNAGTVTAATRWAFGGFRGWYATDGASTSAIRTANTSEYALDVKAASYCRFQDIIIQSANFGLNLGNNEAAGDQDVNQCVFDGVQFPSVVVGYNGAIATNIQSATGNQFSNCYFAGGGKQIPNSRALKIASSANGDGCDGNLFVNCIWNFNDNDMDYGFEFDATNPAVQNSKFSNCTMDCGKEYAILFKIGSAATSENCTIFNHAFTGCRITAGIGHPSGGGGAVHIVQEDIMPIHGIQFSGCVFGVGCNNPFYKHERSGGAAATASGISFDGCTIGISPSHIICEAATTANITLSGVQNIDGVTGSANQAVLVKNQSTASENGVYLQNAGAWARVSTFDDWDNDTVEAVVAVTGGSTNGATFWLSDASYGGTFGTTALAFSSFDPTRTLLEIDGNNFTFTNNTITYWANKSSLYSSFSSWPFLDYVATFSAAAIRGAAIQGNNFRDSPNSLVAADMSNLSSTSILDGPLIRDNIGCIDPPTRMVQTTDATLTEIGRFTLINGQSSHLRGYIIGKRNNDTETCKFTFETFVIATGGSITIKAGGTMTAAYEADDTSTNCTISNSGLSLIFNVQGPAAKTYDWALYVIEYGANAA